MSKEIKYMSIKEFREKGYLQELNRRFLHPLGLALEISIQDNGKEVLGGIWDYRDDPEGIYYDLKNSNEKRIKKFSERAQFIDKQMEKYRSDRILKLGAIVEPIPDIS